jgi:hypothetical protein
MSCRASAPAPVPAHYGQFPVEVLQEPPSIPKQSPLELHSTQVPAMDGLLMLPQTCACGFALDVQGVPVGAGSNWGAEGLPAHAGLMRQAELEVGRSVASSTLVTPPEPLQTDFWQSPGDWFVVAVPMSTGSVPQRWLASQVRARHSLPVGGQSFGTLHATQPTVAAQTWLVAAQSIGVAATQAFDASQVPAGV